jgi:hypothetical protein
MNHYHEPLPWSGLSDALHQSTFHAMWDAYVGEIYLISLKTTKPCIEQVIVDR